MVIMPISRDIGPRDEHEAQTGGLRGITSVFLAILHETDGYFFEGYNLLFHATMEKWLSEALVIHKRNSNNTS